MTDNTHNSVNPILAPTPEPAADLTRIEALTVHRRTVRTKHRHLRDLRRAQAAVEALDGLDKETEIFGFTKGQFSIIDILSDCLRRIGPADLFISTWTAANTDVTTVLEFVNTGLIRRARWLVDLTFQRRSPQLAQRIRQVFGPEAIRVARNHAKFAMLTNAEWKLVLRTSMNLNFNPRFEDFTLANDPDLADFLTTIIDEIWTKKHRSLADARPYDIHKHFAADL